MVKAATFPSFNLCVRAIDRSLTGTYLNYLPTTQGNATSPNPSTVGHVSSANDPRVSVSDPVQQSAPLDEDGGNQSSALWTSSMTSRASLLPARPLRRAQALGKERSRWNGNAARHTGPAWLGRPAGHLGATRHKRRTGRTYETTRTAPTNASPGLLAAGRWAGPAPTFRFAEHATSAASTSRLRHDEKIYDQISTIQGRHAAYLVDNSTHGSHAAARGTGWGSELEARNP